MFVAVATILMGGKAHAASFTVATGNDENTDNSSCALSEAIENINNQATTNTDCSPTGAYGTDDTINLPAGTITLTDVLPTVTSSVAIRGQGMHTTTVDGDGQWRPFFFYGSTNNQSAEITGLKITAFSESAIQAESVNTTIDQVEVDGDSAVFSTGANTTGRGIGISNRGDSPITASITNIYIHDIASSGTANVFGLIASTGDDGAGTSEDIQTTIANVTVANLSGPNNVFAIVTGAGMYSNGVGSGEAHSTVSNVTVTSIVSTAGPAAAILTPALGMGSHNVYASISNVTIKKVLGGIQSPLFGGASSVGLLGLAGGFIDGQHNVISLNSTNVVVADVDLSCATTDVSAPVFGTNSTSDLSFASGGGNLSDNTSCSSYFNQPTDQNNVANLNSSLAALAYNGGYVPTMALKQGSPAIDAGITVSGLTTDARLATRPQGNAYDSGAYESPYTKAVETSSESLAGTGQNNLLILIAAFTSSTLGAALALYVTKRRSANSF